MKAFQSIIFALLPFSALASDSASDPCDFRAPNHIPEQYLIKHVDDVVSRDFYYIYLKETTDKIEICGMVGGEHITHYRILGFQNEHYEINSRATDGILYKSVTGKGVQVVGDDTGTLDDVLVISDEPVWIDISVSASFDSFTSNYEISIRKD